MSLSKSQAHTLADQLVAQLDGALGLEWKKYVWNNLGWHYGAESSDGRWFITCSAQGQDTGEQEVFYSFLGEDHAGYWTGMGETPRKAIEAARQEALETIRDAAYYLDLKLDLPES